MFQTLESYKHMMGAIVKVTRTKNKLLFYSAKHITVPHKIIFTDNIKSINVFKNTALRAYTTHFNYYNDTDSATLLWYYGINGHSWEDETVKLINNTIELTS